MNQTELSGSVSPPTPLGDGKHSSRARAGYADDVLIARSQTISCDRVAAHRPTRPEWWVHQSDRRKNGSGLSPRAPIPNAGTGSDGALAASRSFSCSPASPRSSRPPPLPLRGNPPSRARSERVQGWGWIHSPWKESWKFTELPCGLGQLRRPLSHQSHVHDDMIDRALPGFKAGQSKRKGVWSMPETSIDPQWAPARGFRPGLPTADSPAGPGANPTGCRPQVSFSA